MRKDASQYVPVILQNSSISVIIQKKKTCIELVQYLHAVCLSPVKLMSEKAINKYHFKTWPGLTPGLLKHLPTPVATVQGHLHQEIQNLQSTRNRAEKLAEIEVIKARLMRLKAKKKPGQSFQDIFQEEIDDDIFPISLTLNIKTHDVEYMIINKDELYTAYTNLAVFFMLIQQWQ